MSQNSITPQQKTDTVTLGGMMKHVEKVMQRYTGEMIGIPNTSEAVYYTQAEADAYNALLEGALNSTDPLTAEEAAAYNAAITGAEKEAGDTLSEAEANAYNATLDGAVSTSDVKTPAVPTSVKDYIDGHAALLTGYTIIDDWGTSEEHYDLDDLTTPGCYILTDIAKVGYFDNAYDNTEIYAVVVEEFDGIVYQTFNYYESSRDSKYSRYINTAEAEPVWSTYALVQSRHMLGSENYIQFTTSGKGWYRIGAYSRTQWFDVAIWMYTSYTYPKIRLIGGTYDSTGSSVTPLLKAVQLFGTNQSSIDKVRFVYDGSSQIHIELHYNSSTDRSVRFKFFHGNSFDIPVAVAEVPEDGTVIQEYTPKDTPESLGRVVLDTELEDYYTKSQEDGRFMRLSGYTSAGGTSTSAVDLNTIKTPGTYYGNGSYYYIGNASVPSPVTTHFRLDVSVSRGSSAGNYLRQRIRGYNGQKVYERFTQDGGTTWNDFALVQDDFSEYLALDGGTMTGTLNTMKQGRTVYASSISSTTLSPNLSTDPGDVRVYTLSKNISTFNAPTGAIAGQQILIIFKSTAARTVAIAHNASSMVCPNAANLSLSVTANGFAAVLLIYDGSKFFVQPLSGQTVQQGSLTQ